MRWQSITLLTICGFIWVPGYAADSVAIKAATPVQISIVPESTPVPAAETTFVVRASSTIPSRHFHIDISLPPGAVLVAGDVQWQGAVYPGQVQELRVSVRYPGQGIPTLSANASIASANGAQLAANAVYRPSTALPSGVTAIRAQRYSSRDGHPVVEYSLK